MSNMPCKVFRILKAPFSTLKAGVSSSPFIHKSRFFCHIQVCIGYSFSANRIHTQCLTIFLQFLRCFHFLEAVLQGHPHIATR